MGKYFRKITLEKWSKEVYLAKSSFGDAWKNMENSVEAGRKRKEAWRGKRPSDAESVLAEGCLSCEKSKKGKNCVCFGGRCVCAYNTHPHALGVCD